MNRYQRKQLQLLGYSERDIQKILRNDKYSNKYKYNKRSR